MKKITYDIVVVGAGVVGTTTALNLQMRGKKVLLIDRRDAGLETSYGNTGVIGTSFLVPFDFPTGKKLQAVIKDESYSTRLPVQSVANYGPWILNNHDESQPENKLKNSAALRPLVTRAAKEHYRLSSGTERDYIHKQGRVLLYHTPESFAGGALERKLATEAGESFDVIDAEEFRKIEPSLRANFHKVVRFNDSPRVSNPWALTKLYQERFQYAGGEYRTGLVKELVPPVDNSEGNLWRVKTDGEDITAKEVVVCTGPWATQILTPLGYNFPMAMKRGYSQHFKGEKGVTLQHAIVDADYGYVISPMEQGYRIVTTGAEFVNIDTPPTTTMMNRVLPHVRELFPLGEKIDAKAWHGNRPSFPDSLPVTGRAPNHKGLWFNFGHGHIGLTLSAPTALLLTQMMTNEETFCDPTPYRANRFKHLAWNPKVGGRGNSFGL